MPLDPYADAAPAPAAAPAEPEAPAPEEMAPEDEAGDAQTAEIPKSALGGADLQPGAELTLQVVQVMEDSVLVKMAGTEEPEAPEEAPPAPQGGPMSSMLQ